MVIVNRNWYELNELVHERKLIIYDGYKICMRNCHYRSSGGKVTPFRPFQSDKGQSTRKRQRKMKLVNRMKLKVEPIDTKRYA